MINVYIYVIPIPKGSNSDVSDSNNYRSSSLCSIVCKIIKLKSYTKVCTKACKSIDVIILSCYSDLLCSSELQFRFKSKMSTGVCTSLIKEVNSDIW